MSNAKIVSLSTYCCFGLNLLSLSNKNTIYSFLDCAKHPITVISLSAFSTIGNPPFELTSISKIRTLWFLGMSSESKYKSVNTLVSLETSLSNISGVSSFQLNVFLTLSPKIVSLSPFLLSLYQ